MSILPEFIFRAVIARGFQTVREDSRLLDQLFRNLDQTSAQDMRDFILKHRIYLDINYPREDLKLPAIIILLKNEEEYQAFLGDSMGVDCVPEEFLEDDFSGNDLADQLLGGAATTSTMAGLGSIKIGPTQALSGTVNTIKAATSPGWDIDQFLVTDSEVHIIGGTGVGQQRVVSSNNADTLMISPNWTTPPDSTSVFVVRGVRENHIGEPTRLYTNSEGEVLERKGALYNLNYQIQVISQNQELTVYLHAILKSIFLMARNFLESQGIINFKLGATDFIPRAEYQPDHAYMRAMNIEFQYPFDIFTAIPNLATSFNLALEGCTDEGKIVLTTTI